MRVIVTTCDKMLWCLRPFAYLFNIYWSTLQPVLIGGYAEPEFALPDNFSFHQINKNNYPAEKWSDGVIQLFDAITDDYFVWMLEDYWLSRTVDNAAVESLSAYLAMHSDVLRIDLTTDRAMSGRARDIGAWGHLDMVETPFDTPYQLSIQACVVNRRNMLRILRPGLTPWQFELQDGSRAIPSGMRVLGTRQAPVRYTIGVGTGASMRVDGIPDEHVEHIKSQGWLEGHE